jgi:hypothetical protein
MCTFVVLNVLEPSALNAEFQYFISLCIKCWVSVFHTLILVTFVTFADRQPGGDEASNEGATQAQQSMPYDFADNSIILILKN